MTLIDAHVHVWDRAVLDYPWLDDEPELGAPRLPVDLTAGATRATGFVFVQADCVPEQGLAEARWVAGLDWPALLGIVAFAALERGADVAGDLDALAEVPGVVGVRRLLQGEPVAAFDSAEWDAGLHLLAQRDLVFDACVLHPQLEALVRLARRHPDLSIVLDHAGKPPLADGVQSEAGRRWRANLDALAALPNVSVKLSGLPAEAPQGFEAHEYSPWIDAVLTAFGPRRTMFGSDWPVSAVGAIGLTSDEWAAVALDPLSPGERDDIAFRTARRVYRLSDAARNPTP
ncbi:amidohydrolase family protein [Agromyces atrinae]|uniref:amidohydrolase family protein n=1 Tax=Agromyces atrinae TaxID=592376 RepID=UPI001F56BFBA|nr:amidohydrolase family protein [Agromyces atrinae]MCI2957170.1 amidohydrolase family protein [Agromyces atrinae]